MALWVCLFGGEFALMCTFNLLTLSSFSPFPSTPSLHLSFLSRSLSPLPLPPYLPSFFLLSSFSYAVRMGHSLTYMRPLQNHHLSYFLLVVQLPLLSPTVVIVLHNCPSHALARLQMTAPPIPTPPNSGPSSSGSHNLGPSLSPPPLPPGTIERTPSPPTTRRWRQSTSFPHEKVADKQQSFGPRSKSPRVSRFCSILESINKCVLKVHVHVYFTHFLLKFSSFLYHSLSLLILSCPPTYTPPISQLYLPSLPFFSFLHLISSHLPSLSSLLIPFPSSHPLSPQAAPPPDEKPHKRMGLWFVEVDR